MTVPDYQSLMLPVLKAVAGGNNLLSIKKIEEAVSRNEGIAAEMLKVMLPSGRMPAFYNRICWALHYLFKAGLVERPQRGHYQITKNGTACLKTNPSRIDIKSLKRIPAFSDWVARTSNREKTHGNGADELDTPEESISKANSKLQKVLSDNLLDRILDESYDFLERLIVDLMLAMGYGGGNKEQGLTTGRSHDGGVDGIIREDKLGFEAIYIQAKRYARNQMVGERELRDFVGAIDSRSTSKGVFVTTARFSSSARQYIERSSKHIVLIDGDYLTELMIQHDIGVRELNRYLVKGIDHDYFEPSD